MVSWKRELGTRAGSGDLLVFYLPLAASGLLMTLQQPVVNAGIARTYEAPVQLAAYGVVLSIVVLLESPIQMLLQTATALVVDAHSFQLVRRLMLLAGLSLTGLGTLLYASPLAVLVTEGLLGLPPEVAETTRIALSTMLPWPLAVAWRRFYQGILIRDGQAHRVGWATLWRLVAIGSTVVLGLLLANPLPGAFLGSLALSVGALSEAMVVTWWARPAVQRTVRNRSGSQSESLTFRGLISFYTPLAMTSVMTIAVWPIVTSALARGPNPALSLGAWPIALSIWWLLGTPLQMFQQVVIAALKGGTPLPRVRHLALAVGVVASVVLILVSFSPLLGFFVTQVIAAPPTIAKAVVVAVHAMTPLPFLAVLQALLQGELIARGTTRPVRTATAANLASLLLILLLGVAWGGVEGTLLATAGLVVSSSVEVILLWHHARVS